MRRQPDDIKMIVSFPPLERMSREEAAQACAQTAIDATIRIQDRMAEELKRYYAPVEEFDPN